MENYEGKRVVIAANIRLSDVGQQTKESATSRNHGPDRGRGRTSGSRKVRISGCPLESAASGKSGIPFHKRRIGL
jgi:hypothetical protein